MKAIGNRPGLEGKGRETVAHAPWSTAPQAPSVAGSARAAVEVHIESLVLDGFAAADRHTIAAGVERELARLIAERGSPALFGASAEVDRVAGSFRGLNSNVPASTARQIAQALYRALESPKTET